MVPAHHLVLVGGGHSHVEVLRNWALDPAPGARLSVISPAPPAVYTAMAQGYVPAQSPLAETEIDVHQPARRSGAQWIEVTATGLDLRSRRLHLRQGASLAYDTISFDV